VAGLKSEQIALLRNLYFLKAGNFRRFDETTTLIDKMPLNTLHLPLIRTVFPDAKILFAMRHPMAVALSCLMQNFTLTNSMGNLTTLEDITRLYAAVMDFWRQQSAGARLSHHVIKYENVIADLEKETRAIAKYLELEWSPAMLDYAAKARKKGMIDTPSYSQVVQPLYKDSIERWRNYQQIFEAYRERLEPYCKMFGYQA
jgi:hypothetical protein